MNTGTLKPTPLSALHRLSTIAPPAIRRDISAKREKHLQKSDPRHPLHDHQEVARRLKSRMSFATVPELDNKPASARIHQWSEAQTPDQFPAVPPPREDFINGTSLKRNEWCTLNRARCKVGCTRATVAKWGYADNPNCDCGRTQTIDHLLNECPLGPRCSEDDLRNLTEPALSWLRHWGDTI